MSYISFYIFLFCWFCREHVNIPYNKPCIIIEGSGRRTTKITYGDGKATTTFFSFPPNVILSGITFEVNTRKRDGATIFIFFIRRNVSKLVIMLVS